MSVIETEFESIDNTNKDYILKLKDKKFNIMVTGTPGVGKSKLSAYLASLLNKHHFDLSKMSLEHHLTSGYDKKLDSHYIDEDLVNDHIDQLLQESETNSNGLIIDYHGVDFFDHPEKITAIVVVTAETSVLKKRYTEREYNDEKINNNLECELFRMLFEEAYEYIEDQNKIIEFPNNDENEFGTSVTNLLERLYNILEL